jgi:F-type H+-transporting ATPase subunit b
MRFALSGRLFALALFAVFALAAPALAADAHAGEGGGGMLDKLKFTGIKRWDLGLYTLIVFGILMFVLAKFAWPKISKGLAAREEKILGALEQAKQDRAEAEARLAEAKKQLAEAAQQASAILAEARKDAEALKVAETEKGAKEAQADRERARREIDAKIETMRKELQQELVQLATLMASKALRRQVTIQNQQELLDESIAELKTGANKA